MISDYSSSNPSALSSRTPSRGTTPIPVQHQHQNPYHIPRFWRGFALGGLTIGGGGYLLSKLGPYIGSYFINKFHREPTPTPTPEPTPEPTPTPKPKKPLKFDDNIHSPI